MFRQKAVPAAVTVRQVVMGLVVVAAVVSFGFQRRHPRPMLTQMSAVVRMDQIRMRHSIAVLHLGELRAEATVRCFTDWPQARMYFSIRTPVEAYCQLNSPHSRLRQLITEWT